IPLRSIPDVRWSSALSFLEATLPRESKRLWRISIVRCKRRRETSPRGNPATPTAMASGDNSEPLGPDMFQLGRYVRKRRARRSGAAYGGISAAVLERPSEPPHHGQRRNQGRLGFHAAVEDRK